MLLLNLREEMSKPIIDLSNIRELLKIDVSREVFEADTRAEQERGLKILEHAQSSAQGSVAAETPFAPAAPIRTASNFMDIVAIYLHEASLTLKFSTIYKHQLTFKAFSQYLGDLPVDKVLEGRHKSVQNQASTPTHEPSVR